MSIAEEAAAVPRGESEQKLSLRSGRGQALLGSITLAHFSHHTSNSLLNPLLPLIRDSFGMSYALSGFAVSAFALSSGLANAPWGSRSAPSRTPRPSRARVYGLLPPCR